MPPGASQPTVIACPRCHTRHFPPGGPLSDGTYQSACRSCGHRFKFRSVVQPRATITLTVNGQQHTVDGNHDSSLTLNQFLRDVVGLTGTKLSCADGGCGVCVVAASRFDPVTSANITLAINSCLCPLWICDGWEITTTEGLGDAQQGYHVIQSRLAEYAGSQCGFCSPGMVMNMYSLLQENNMPTQQEVEDGFDGNICRCTGFRPILDAMKSFAVDSSTCDIEDVGKVCCKKGGRVCQTKTTKLTHPEPLYMVLRNGAQWVRPGSLPELYQLLDIYKDHNYMLVFGKTSTGIFNDGPFDVFIDIRGILDLYSYTLSGPLEFGANVTLTQLAALLDQAATSVIGFEYCADSAALIKKVAGIPVRNAGCWAGNVMIKHAHRYFTSDVFVLLETINAQITVGSSEGTVEYSPLELLSVDMNGKAILKVTLFPLTQQDVVRTIKTMPRSQNAGALVSAGFNMRLDPSDNYRVLQTPSIVYGGLGAQQIHASETEAYLTDKQLGDPDVLAGALDSLNEELVADESSTYRKNVAIALFYKYVLGALSDIVGDRFKSGATELHRPLSEGVQDYSTDPSQYPITEPMPKRTAQAQAAGEAVYVDDLPPVAGQLYASFVISTVGNATLADMDASEALAMPGVVDFLTASAVPAGGVNSFMPPRSEVEPVLVENQVEYAGQALGIIIADSQAHADAAAKVVQVTYENMQPPLTDISEAIEQGSFFPKPGEDLIAGDAEGAIADSPHVIEGEVKLGTQAHFTLETQVCICTPTEEGVDVLSTTQWVDNVQEVLAQVLGTQMCQIQVKVKRLGGGFGAKITRNNQIAAACAMAAVKLNRPVRMMTSFNTTMEMIGKRCPYVARYQIGVSDDGKLNGLKITLYSDAGHSPNDDSVISALFMIDNVYFCENWHLEPMRVKTNLPGNTYCRSPGALPAIYIMEYIMDHVAKELEMDPLEIRKLNFYQDGQTAPWGQVLEHVNIGEMTAQLEASADIAARRQEIQAFNEANRWKKRSLSFSAVKWGIYWGPGITMNIYLTVYARDASIAITHSGVEMGQGVNIKTIQACAHELDIPMEKIYVRATEDFTNTNSPNTAGFTSELCCYGVIQCAKALNERLEPYSSITNWEDRVQAAFADGVDLTARHWVHFNREQHPNRFMYFCYGTSCTETELDVLTGQYQIPRCDVIYDVGQSINPDVDIGQVEGGLVMGIGYCLYEKTQYNPATGQNVTNGTYGYRPPTSKDIPTDFRVTLLKDTPNPVGVLGSKAVGEPPMCLSCSSWFSIKDCVEAARGETGEAAYFRMDLPATTEDAQLLSLNDIGDYVLQ